MNNKNTETLISKYPKIFKLITNPYQGPQLPISLFTFEHGDGWFDIINKLCSNIQHHIDWSRKQRASALKFNRALTRAILGDQAGLIKYFSYNSMITDYTMKSVDAAIEAKEFREVPEKVPQVVATQVKEKFGTLRFYYDGGNEYISGLVSMAESMSGCICETCGDRSTKKTTGWIKTVCDKHYKEKTES